MPWTSPLRQCPELPDVFEEGVQQPQQQLPAEESPDPLYQPMPIMDDCIFLPQTDSGVGGNSVDWYHPPQTRNSCHDDYLDPSIPGNHDQVFVSQFENPCQPLSHRIGRSYPSYPNACVFVRPFIDCHHIKIISASSGTLYSAPQITSHIPSIFTSCQV